jgi:hypothetical protein
LYLNRWTLEDYAPYFHPNTAIGLPHFQVTTYYRGHPIDRNLARIRALHLYQGYRNHQNSLLRILPVTYQEDRIEELAGLFPGLDAPGTLEPFEQPFRLEESLPNSYLRLRIFLFWGIDGPLATRPSLNFDQLIALALLAQRNRTADLDEITACIIAAYPWFRNHSFFHSATCHAWQAHSYLFSHLRRYLQRMNHRLEAVFTPANPASRQLGAAYTSQNVGRVWYLRPGAENMIFREPYRYPEHAALAPIPWRPNGLNFHHPLIRLPEELRMQILERLLVFDGTIFIVYSSLLSPLHPQTPQYFLGNPEWMHNAVDPSPVSVRPSEIRVDGRDIPGQLVDPAALLSNVDSVDPHLRPLAVEVFYGRNTFSVVPDYRYVSRTDPAGHHGLTWLQSLDPLARGFVRRIELPLEFYIPQPPLQSSTVRSLLRTLGARLDPHVTLRIDSNTLSQQELANPRSIPGMDILRRFRGSHHIRIVAIPPIPSLDALVQSWVSRPHSQSHPSQALLAPPLAVGTLQRRTQSELERTARQYDYNPARYNRLPDGGDPNVRASLARFIHAERVHEYYDAMDNQVLPLRQRPTLTLRRVPLAPLQPPNPADPAVQWIRDHEIDPPSAPQTNNNNGNSDIPSNKQDGNQEISPLKREFQDDGDEEDSGSRKPKGEGNGA